MTMRTDMTSLMHAPLYIAEVLANALNDGGEAPLLRLEDGPALSASDVRDATSRFAQALSRAGIVAVSRIALLSRNRPECLHLAHAVQMLGAVYVPLHPLSGIADHLNAVRDAEVDLLVFEAIRFDARAEEIAAQAPGLALMAFGASAIAGDLIAIADTFAPLRLAAPASGPHDVLRLGYSGGTTGKPKAIPSCARSGAVTGQLMLSEWEWPCPPHILSCAPLSHAGAAMFMPALLRGGSLLVLDGFDPIRVLAAIERHRINCMLVVPTMIYALLDCPRLGEFDLSSLETVFYGASAISPTRLKEAIERIGPIFAQFYGQAEAPMCVTYLRKADHDVTDPKRLASCGKPSPWVRVALLDAQGEPVAEGMPGEICVRGPLVMDGYLDPTLNDEVFRGGWLHTGDVAVRDPGGFLRIVDRTKDMIVSGGFNIYPREIEDILGEHPAVARTAVIGVPHEKWGEAMLAIVVRREEGQDVATEALIEMVRARKGAFQAPKAVLFVDEIPATAVGKPDKMTLRTRHAAFFTG